MSPLEVRPRKPIRWRMAQRKKQAIVCVSDLHIGSYFGLCPPQGILLDGGGGYTPNKFQVGLWGLWRHFWGQWLPWAIRGYEIAGVVINGDVLEGLHHQRTGVVSTTWVSMENAAVKILQPIRELTSKFFIVRGTEAHAAPMAEAEEKIADRLKAFPSEAGDKSHWQLPLHAGHTEFHFAHHIGVTSSAAYETSAPMRELITGLIEAAQWERPLAHIFTRSHRHRFVAVPLPGTVNGKYRRRWLVVTPGWQLRTPHVERIDRMRMPHIGGVVYCVEDGECEIREKLYRLPEPKTIRL